MNHRHRRIQNNNRRKNRKAQKRNKTKKRNNSKHRQQRPHSLPQAIVLFQKFMTGLGAVLTRCVAFWCFPMGVGILLAVARRRTVTKWIQAAGLNEHYQRLFYHLTNIGRKSPQLFSKMLEMITEYHHQLIHESKCLRIVLDDSPTKRYGSKVEGAGYHHNPTAGRTDATFCYGHSWVVAVLVLTHPQWGEISLPVGMELYLRQKEIDKLQKKYHREFKLKTELAVKIVKEILPKLITFNKSIEIIVDGGYAKDTVILPLLALKNVREITRLRRDSALFEVVVPPKRRGRGRPKIYGNKIKMIGKVHVYRGWQNVECVQYGKQVTQSIKTFIATSRLTGGQPIRVVIVKKSDGTWVPLMSTDTELSVKDILESYAVRFGIEEVFKDLKEVWGWGKQEVRCLESNEAATTLNMLLYNIVELATWNTDSSNFKNRLLAPWDDQTRIPSHADKRNFLRYHILKNEFINALPKQINPKIFEPTLKKLCQLAG